MTYPSVGTTPAEPTCTCPDPEYSHLNGHLLTCPLVNGPMPVSWNQVGPQPPVEHENITEATTALAPGVLVVTFAFPEDQYDANLQSEAMVGAVQELVDCLSGTVGQLSMVRDDAARDLNMFVDFLIHREREQVAQQLGVEVNESQNVAQNGTDSTL